MNRLLNSDISIKVISILVAVGLWLYVVNIDNPFDNVTFKVKLKVINMETLEEKGLKLIDTNLPETIEITVRGRGDTVKNISPDDFTAELDFSKVKSERDKRIKIDGPYHELRDITVRDVNPSAIEIKLDRIKEEIFPVEVEVINKLGNNYKIAAVSHSPETVRLKDVESLIDTVSSVKVIVEVENVNGALSINNVSKVYNKNQEEIPSLSRDVHVDADIDIAKQVEVAAVVKGRPSSDYVEVSRSTLPQRVFITGPYKVIEKINRLNTEPVNIENISQNISVYSPIDLPESVSLVDSPREVRVNINVEKVISKDFNISREDIGIKNTNGNGQLKYEIMDSNVSFKLKGRQSQMQNLEAESLKPYIEVDGLKEGEHTVPLKLAIPAGVELSREALVKINIMKPSVLP
jgi:YbbR domain-containing protein